MLWLAIAQLRGWLHSMVGNIASPTQNVGHVCREHTTQTGKACSAETTSLRPQPANLQASQNNEVVQPTSAEPNSGKKTQRAATVTQSKEVGTKPVTPAQPTRQRVKQAPKAKQKAVQPTLPVQLSAQDKVPAQTHTGNLSGGNGKLKAIAQSTHRRAKPAPKVKQKVAKLDMLDKQRTPVKASAQTPTVQPSGDNGT